MATPHPLLPPLLLLLTLLSTTAPRPPPPGCPTTSTASSTIPLPSIPIPLVETFPPLPSPYLLPSVDFTALARNQTALVFSLENVGTYTPLIWWDDESGPSRTFGTPSYVGPRQGSGEGNHELIAGGGLVLSGFLTGANMSCLDVPDGSGGVLPCVDFEAMLAGYFDVPTNVWKDVPTSSPNSEFWYQAWMSMLPVFVDWAGRSVRNGAPGPLSPFNLNASVVWADVLAQLGGGPSTLPDVNFTGVNFTTGTPGVVAGYYNGRFTQPVASGGLAWLLYTASRAFPDDPHAPAFLEAADWGLRALEAVPYDPYWEVLLPYAALAAARMNTELRGSPSAPAGVPYDLHRLLTWVLQDDQTPARSPFRWGWGVTADVWGGVDVDGLVASVTDRDGYAFNMDSAAALAALLPVARYNASYAHSLARFAVNAFNAARLFYPAFVDPEHQSDWAWASGLSGAFAGVPSPISYEGVRKWGFNESSGGGSPLNNLTGPYATGDAKWDWGSPTNIAIYGSAYTGLYAALLVRTNVSTVPAFDLLATDPHHAPGSYPTRLLVNPDAGAPVPVAVPVGGNAGGGGPVDVYDAASQAFVARGQGKGGRRGGGGGGGDATGEVEVEVVVPAGAAMVLVAVPAEATLAYDAQHGWLLADGIVIDWASTGLPTRG
jgi:hypothetical protein